MINLKNFRLVSEKADEELKIASQAQDSEPKEYEKAKAVYRRAYYSYVSAINEFCATHHMGIEFDPTKCYDNKYNH